MANNFFSYFFGIDGDQYNGRYINQFQRSLASYANLIGQKQAVWIDTFKAYEHYIEIPELRTVVDRRASMMASGVPILYDENGGIVESHWVLDLIKNPNPLQSWSDVIYSMSVNDALFSVAFAYAPKRSFDIVNLMVPLPTNKMKVFTTGKKFKQMDAEGWIEKVQMVYSDDSKEDFTLDELVYLITTDGMNLVNPSSRIESLKFPLSNIRAQYNKRNVLLENIGAIGILSAKNSDIGGALPLTPEEKRDIRNDWYARSKDELIITEADVTWNPMSYPTKDLMLFEELNADKMAIIDVYGMSVYLFSQDKGATFANVRDGIKMTYTDTIIPETEQMYAVITEQLGLSAEGLKLIPDFSHIPALQQDELSHAQALNTKADALLKIRDAGIILTEEERKALLGL